jgi:rRNA processing protein Krr1/Pno1
VVKEIFSDETDHLLRIIKRIMYAEGDTVELKTECAVFIKDQLRQIIGLLKMEDCKRSLDLNLLLHLYKAEITKFYRTKRLTKGLAKEDEAESSLDSGDEILSGN